MNHNLVEILNIAAGCFHRVLEAAGVDDVPEDPDIRRMADRWVCNMHCSSLLEAVAYLFVGVVCVTEVLKDAIEESGLGNENGLSYLDDLGISDSPLPMSPPLGIN